MLLIYSSLCSCLSTGLALPVSNNATILLASSSFSDRDADCPHHFW
jgi:hypothetical protein